MGKADDFIWPFGMAKLSRITSGGNQKRQDYSRLSIQLKA
jgi:hypothetical protein